ncbi:flavonol synthase/flavanone 3-hydroxylase-like [Amaranthus tricolor]|uniref:flavonol synthase/flavanone 3-hydroxylase-like n=1 Tax=Amaranthus tricolor TaxID=29722 RepID=UPI0025877630|nr:flavonol synthase/flavanone 3-hydroxylase-like [Amaranthus tricolor]
MAAPSLPPKKLELPPKPVQELIKTERKQVPERYIQQHLKNPVDQPEINYMDSSIIDFSLLSNSSPRQREELQKLRNNLSSWGCFQLINHGCSSSLLHRLREVHKEFFALPLEMKKKYSRTLDWIEGYGSDTVTEDQSYNWNDRLQLKVYPVEQKNFKFWPEEDVQNFRETLNEYAKNMRRVLEIILKAIAKSLSLEETTFYRECEGEQGIYMLARFNYYPPCSSPDLVFGLKPHSDVSAITILLQDNEVEGLQVQKDDQWFKVPIIPDALFINIGDQLEIMSNGILKSAMHKVVIDKDRERMSMAVACSPHPEKEIGPLGELIDQERPQSYKNVKNYVRVYLQYSPTAERAINAMKIK